MKKKQFMSKLAALTMAAAMGITALPATAVFAQTTSTEASDTKLASSDYITVKKTFNGTDADADVWAANSSKILAQTFFYSDAACTKTFTANSLI